MLKSLIFDVDGTLADTEEAHRAAFNYAFREAGYNWAWDLPQYTRLLEVTGGKERILHYWKQVQPDFQAMNNDAVLKAVEQLHAFKTAAYERAVRAGAVQMRPGVMPLLDAAFQQGLQLAIATTTSSANISALLQTAIGPDWQLRFTVVEDASTAPLKKPHPLVYLQALHRLQLSAGDCLAFEDSANGLQSAQAAGLKTIVTPNRFTEQHNFQGAWRVLPSLQGISVSQLRAWHSSDASAAAFA
jgi:HAD superfamily hydrolase (TIGR01509 family)